MDQFNRIVMDKLESLSYEQIWSDKWTKPVKRERRLRILDNETLDLRYPSFELGKLAVLHPEILTMILLEVDLKTLISFRAVNRKASIVINAIHEYKMLLTMGGLAKDFALSIGELPWISCKDLYAVMTKPSCSRCGQFASHVYLLTCERACLPCLGYRNDFLPLSPAHAQHEFGISQKIVKRLPRAMHAWSYRTGAKVFRLIDRTSAFHEGIKLHGSYEQMKVFVAARAAKIDAMYEKRVALAALTTAPKRQPFRRIFKYSDNNTGNRSRFTAVSRAPVVDPTNNFATWGVSCRGCYVTFVLESGMKDESLRVNSLRIYTVREFLAHARYCKGVKDILSRMGFKFL